MKNRTTMIALSLLWLAHLGAPALAEKQAPPAGGPPRPFTVPRIETFSLPNGFRATLAPYGQVPKVKIAVITRSGNINEESGQVWLADLTGEMIKEGTTTRTADAVADEAARMGGTIGIQVNPDQTTLQTEVLSEFGPKAVKLLADVAQHPLLPDSEMARLKTDALRRLSIERSQPQSLALERFRQVLYPDHPYGHLFPTEESLNKLAAADVRKFYESNFGAARTHIFVAGRFGAAEMRKAIGEEFGKWPRGPEAVNRVPAPKPGRVLELVERPGASQSTLYLGLPVAYPGNPDYVQLDVTNALLGGSFGSRVTSNIREQKGYTYSPRSSLSTRYHDAYWVQTADVTTDVTGPALKEIFYEIGRLRDEAPPEKELEGIRNYLSGLFVIRNSSRDGIINQLNFVDLHELGDDFLRTYVQKVNAVTPAQVQAMTKKYLVAEQMAIVVAGDGAKIADQIAPYRP